MRFEFILITIVTLAVLVTCTPLQTTNATRIPLRKRGSFIKHDGSFDLHGAMEHIAHIENKYRRNTANFRRNVSREAFNDNADIEPLPAFPVRLRKLEPECIPLRYHDNRIWTSDIEIGLARAGMMNQVFAVSFDTGSADLWVPSVDCDCIGCEGKNKYNHEDSKNSLPKNEEVEIKSASGVVALAGDVYTDIVKVGEIIVYRQHFVNAWWISDLFKDTPYDGIIGMGFPSLSFILQRPFFSSVTRGNYVPKGIFAFALDETDSELCLGGINKSKHDGHIEYHSLVSSEYWQIGGASAIIGETVAVKKLETRIDSGSSFILGPLDDIKKLFSYITDSSRYLKENGDDRQALYQYPCNRPPDFKISWGGTWWSVPQENFSNGETKSGSGMCISTVLGVDYLPANTWSVGTAFMKNVYTVFDFDTHAVGFAPRLRDDD